MKPSQALSEQVAFVCVAFLCAGVLSFWVDAGETNVEQLTDWERIKQADDKFFANYGDYIFGVTNATLPELRMMLTQPLSKEFAVEEVMRAPPYQYLGGENPVSDMAALRWLENCDDSLLPIEPWSQLLAEYMHKERVTDRLARADPQFSLRCMVERKDKLPPTLFDIVLTVGPATWNKDFVEATARGTDGKRQWRQLAQGKNPVYRMFALRWSKVWADPAEQLTLWKKTLADEYWYSRLLAARFLGEIDTPAAREALRLFMKRPIAANLAPEYKAKEKELTETALKGLGVIERVTPWYLQPEINHYQESDE